MDRRQALKSFAVAGSVSLAGCSLAKGSEGSGTVLGKIEIVNSSFTANRIRVIVTRDDDELVDTTFELPALNDESETPVLVVEPSWSKTKGQYKIIAMHQGRDGDSESLDWEYTFTKEDYDEYYGDDHRDPGCIPAVVKIGSLDENRNAPIGIGPTYMRDPCGSLDSE